MKQKFAFEPRCYAVIWFFIVGMFLGALVLFIWIFNGGTFYGIVKIHPGKSNYKFINPLLAVEANQPKDFFENDPLKNKVSALVAAAKKNNQLEKSGIYFQDLESGHWFGLNEDTKFSAGVFLKVPIMIAFLKASESDSNLLKKTLVYKLPKGYDNGGNQINFVEGQRYTVDEIIKDMIIDDSDASASILFDNINKAYLNEVYSDLGISYKEDKTTVDFITTKLNSLFFRVLYNATYLNRANSEKALDIISQGDLGTGFARALPNEVTIAHRIRELQTTLNGRSIAQVTDCGIIYYPNHPYILCAMLAAKDSSFLDSFLKQISETVYQEVENKKIKS